jgi:beta-propeller repeat-containing protein/WD40 repeat protein
MKVFAGLPMSFEANQGQTDARVQFLSRGAGYTLFLTHDEAVLSLPTKTRGRAPNSGAAKIHVRPDVLTMRLAGADPAAEVTGLDAQNSVTNYFNGSDSKNWHTHVPNYARVKYANVYPGVDQVYYGNQSQLESDFIVAPGADPSAITLEIRGARRMRLNPQGDLILSTSRGELRLLKPVLYQPASGAANGRTEIKGNFVIRGPRRVGFAPGPYDRTRPLVIDPVMSFFSYFAGNGNDYIRAVALDQQGNMYVTGQTTSDDMTFPPSSAGEGCDNNLDCAAGDIFVFKISFNGTPGNSPQLAYWNFFFVQIIGQTVPPHGDFGNAIAVDSQGNAYVAGTTASGDFGIVNPCTGCQGSSFVAELDPTGNIIFSTTFAGLGSQINGLALDSASPPHIFVAGTLQGDSLTPNTANGFTPVNAFQQSGPAQSSGLSTGFIAELGTTTACPSAVVDCVLYATFFGGTKGAPGDFINGIAVDNQGLVYVTGTTSTNDFPVNSKLTGYSQTTCLTTETCTLVFLAKLDPTAGANGLLYSTTLGLPSPSASTPVQYVGNAVAVAKDGSGYAYITGNTGNQVNGLNNQGLYFPTTSGAIGAPGNNSCIALSGGGATCPGSFVSEINTNATGSSSLVASTYLGGVHSVSTYSPFTSANAIAVDAAGNAFVVGGTNSTDFPLPNFSMSSTAIQNVLPSTYLVGGQDTQSIFLAVLPSGLNSVLYSTYLGGSGLTFPSTVGNISYSGAGSDTASDFANAIALDSSGNAYIAGQETSGNFYIAASAGTLSVYAGDSTGFTYHGWAEIIGTGITPPSTYPIVSIVPSGGINFGNVGLTGSAGAPLMVENIGSAPLSVYGITIVPDSGTPASTFTESNNCAGKSIAISTSCNVSVVFTPPAIGSYAATLEVQDSATSGTQTARLTGTGVAPFPEIGLTLIQNGVTSTSFNDTVQFGTVEQGGSSPMATIEVRNSGTASLVLGTLQVVVPLGGISGDITTSGDTCSGQTIPVFVSCQINLTFAPVSAPETQDDLVLVIPNNTPTTPQDVALIGTSGTPQAPPAAIPVLASVNDDVPPVPANSGSGAAITPVHSAVSSGGQYVAFESAATNLPGPQTTTSALDSIYLRTICLQAPAGCTPLTNFISYGPTTGANANGGAPCNINTAYLGSVKPAIDSTGQFVAFLSDACVASSDGTPEAQIYLRNVTAKSTSLISLNDSGNALNNGLTAYSMSANARYFAYSSSSSNVAGLTSNFVSQIFLRDATCTPPSTTCTANTLISQEPNGSPTPASALTEQPSISPDGRYVVFSSGDTNLPAVPPKTFAANAVVLYLRDTCNGATGSCTPTTTAISVDSTGTAVSGGEGAAVANGGRFILFASFACSLLPGGCTGTSPEEVYLADTCTYNGVAVPSCVAAPPKLISIDQVTGQPDTFLSASVGPPSITADGRLAMFTSNSPLLLPTGPQAIYAYDTCTTNGTAVASCTSALHLVSVDSSGAAFGNGSDLVSIDATGQFVSFGTGGDPVTTQNPTPMSGGVYLGLSSGFAGSTAPALQITPLALDFGNVLPPATSSTQTITVTNSSPLSTVTGLALSLANLINGFAYVSSSSNDCQTTSQLLPLQSCTSQVDFAPPVLGQQETASFAYNATSVASQTVTLTGWGGKSAIIFEDMNGNPVSTVNFGTVQTGTTGTFQGQLANTGTSPVATAPLDFLPYSVTGGPFGANLSQCPSNPSPVTNVLYSNLLAPGASCVVTLSFTPTTAGPASGLFTIVDNAQTSNIPVAIQTNGLAAHSLPLSGTAGGTTGSPAVVTDNETITVTDTETFPDIFDSEMITVTDTVTVKAMGGTNATTTTITSASSTYQGLALPANLALVGAPITVNFKVQPTSSGAPGPATGSVTVVGINGACPTPVMLTSSSDGAGSCPLTIPQLGTGSNTLSAIYTPDSNSSALLPSTSSPYMVSVVQITACGPLPAAQTSAEGTTVTFTFSTCLATDVAAVPNAVVTGCPPNAQCTATVTSVSAFVYSVVVTIVLPSAENAVLLQEPRPWSKPLRLPLVGFGVLLAILMAFQWARQNRPRPRLLYAAGFLIAVLFSGMAGCTSASLVNGGGGGGGTPVGNFIIKVNVTAGNFSTTVPLSLTVTK